MTPERAKELLPVMQARSAAKTVQFKTKLPNSADWLDYEGGALDPHFLSTGYLWRVKPEPREWWLCLKCRNGIRESINNGICPWCHGTYTHVREVLP